MKKIKMPEAKLKAVLIFAVVTVTTVLLLQTYNKAYREFGNDFTLFVNAAQMIYEGEDPRDIIWPYPYFMPTVFIPFLFLPKGVSVFLWFAINAGALFLTVKTCYSVFFHSATGMRDTGHFAVYTVALFVLLPVIQNDFLNGQVNLIIVLLTVLSIQAGLEGKTGWAAFFLSLAVMLKITPALFLFYFVVRKQWKLIGYTFLLLFLFALLPFLFLGFQNLIAYYSGYFHHILHQRLTYNIDITHSILLSFEDALTYLLQSKPPVAVQWTINMAWLLGIVGSDMYQRVKSIPFGDWWMAGLYSITILLFSPLSEIHHINLIIPAVIFLSLKTYMDMKQNQYWTGIGAGLFVLTFYLGRIDKTGPLMFCALILLCGLIYAQVFRKTQV